MSEEPRTAAGRALLDQMPYWRNSAHSVNDEVVAAIRAIEEAAAPVAGEELDPKECGICGDYTASGIEVHELCLGELTFLAASQPVAEEGDE